GLPRLSIGIGDARADGGRPSTRVRLAVVMSAPLAPWRFAAIRLGVFVALAVFPAWWWLSLLADPPVARACVALAAVAGGASLLAVIEWAGFEGWRRS